MKTLNPLCRPCQKHLLRKKGVIFGFGQSQLKPLFYRVSWFTLFWAQKILAKTDSVHENTRFSPFLTQTVSGNFCYKSIFFDFSQFWVTTLNNTIFIGFFGLLHFFFFMFLVLQHTKNKKCNFLSKTSFLTFPKFCNNTILAQFGTICVFKHTPKHYKNGENSETLGPVFSFKLGPVLTLNPPNLDPFLTIYICSGAVIWAMFGHLRGYYLGQVCFYLACQNPTTNIGFSTLFLKLKLRKKNQGSLSGPGCPFYVATN